MIKILITGANGQLGTELLKSIPSDVNVLPLTKAELDLYDTTACKNIIFKEQPDWVLNAGAYTAVDKAEEERVLVKRINAYSAKAFAKAIEDTNGRLIQISTDFVFNGLKNSPYQPEDQVSPLNIYGKSKALAENATLKNLGSIGRSHVLRTSWLYGPTGNNFLLTMLRLHESCSNKNQPLSVVSDQIGSPTSTKSLSQAIWKLISSVEKGQSIPSILHWRDSGITSWYDFAVAIGDIGLSVGLLKKAALVKPITTAEYPTAARRPSYSVLDTNQTQKALQLQTKPWREALLEVIKELKNQKREEN